MCEFKSALVLKRNGGIDVLHHPLSNSHSELEELFKVRDTMENRTCKVEFYPDDKNHLDQPDKYVLHIDGDTPYWWTDKIHETVTERLKAVIDGMIAKADGKHIGECVIARDRRLSISHCLMYALGSSTVTALDSSTVTALDSSKVEAWGSSTVTALDSSKVEAWGSSTVTARDSSTVTAWGSSTVTDKRIKK